MDFNSERPQYSIIIPVLNDAAAADQCLGRISADLKPEIEVIVVDGGSLDDTRERIQLKYPDIRLLEAEPGRGSQMNCGAAAARGDILLFLHADSVLPPDWKGDLDNAFAKNKIELTAFRLRFSADEFRYRLLEAGVDMRSLILKLPYGDQAYAVRRKSFQQLQGFQEGALMEDVDFLRRIKKIGKIKILRSNIFSSTRNWRQDGFLRRSRINLTTLFHYFRGRPVKLLASAYRGRKNCVLVFCKKPEPGKVKTRLARSIGKAEAAALYSDMAEKTLQNLQLPIRPYQVLICFDPAKEYEYFINWLGSLAAYLPQGSGTLGDRMAGAVRTAEAIGYTDLVLIGTDCPALQSKHIETALNLLESCDAVVGPSKDGGYYLIAMHSGCPDLFEGIPWSTEDVLTQTLEKASQAGLQVRQLETLHDVDTVHDLKHI